MRFSRCLILVIVISFCPFFRANAQAKKNMVLQSPVKVPDSVRNQLACFELNKNKLETSSDSSYLAMYISNLAKPHESSFKAGIYTYQILGPHFSRKIFIYYKGRIQPFKSVFINDLLNEFLSYTETVDLPVKLRVDYLRLISFYLKEEYTKEL